MPRGNGSKRRRGNGRKRRAAAEREDASAPKAESAPNAASAPTVKAPLWASSPDDTSAASWGPLTPDEMKEKYGHLIIGVPYGLQYPKRWCPRDLLVAAEVEGIASEPATSSSVLLQNRRIPKRLQNNKMSKMALNQSRLRMETREYLSCLYRRAAGFFWISFPGLQLGLPKL